ncbi:MAG: hypothetical protein M1819_006202 [Sarea resinae]|nr:MAG: hypothetical protein M1819_006202 [Sarea resinae]
MASESVNVEGAKVTLYWLEKSRAQRILWLLEEAKAPYELKTYKRGKDFLADPELKKIHPLGKSPIISVESPATTKPVVLAESGLITEYISEYFGPWLIPRKYQEGKEGQIGGETEAFLRYRYYMHYAEGSLMSFLLITFFIDRMRSGSPIFIRPIVNMITGKIESFYTAPNFTRHFDFLESQLATSGGDFLCGKEITGADILMSFPIEWAGFDKTKYPKCAAYLKTMHERDAYKKSIQKIIDVEGSYDPGTK